MKRFTYQDKGNISGDRIRELRLAHRWAQSILAARMQVKGVTIGQEAISRIESGCRLVTDFELLAFASVLNTSVNYLLGIPDECKYL